MRVTELRRYTLRPGQRSRLVELFEQELTQAQEALGMRIDGPYENLDRPDEFVWFRSFADMQARRAALEAFYFGPVWRRHRNAANATMLDSDNVLLLRPTDPPRPIAERPGHRLLVTVYEYPPDRALTRWLTVEGQPRVADLLGVPVGCWRTEPAENTFPALPVRAANAFVWAAAFADGVACAAGLDRLAAAEPLLPVSERLRLRRACPGRAGSGRVR